MRECPSCGERNVEEVDFCARCGEYLRWEETGVDLRDTSAPPQPPVPAPPDAWPAPPGADGGEVAPPPAAPVVAADQVLVTLRPADGDPSAAAETRLEVEAGAHARALALVRNQTQLVGAYDLRVDGLPDGWASAAPSSLNLLPFGSSETGYEQEVELRFHPPRSPQALARAWPFSLTVTDHAEGARVAGASGTLVVGPFHELSIAVRPARIAGERTAEAAVRVSNGGNAPLVVALRGEDADGQVALAFQPDRVEVPPGAERTSRLRAKAPELPRGQPRERSLTVHAEGNGAVASTSLSFAQTAEAPVAWRRWWIVARVLLTLLAAAMLIGGAFATWATAGGAGLDGVCTGGDGSCLRYDDYLDLAFPGTPDTGFDDAGPFQGTFDFVTSVGFVSFLLGLIALLGLRRGTATWIAGVLAIVAVIVFAVTIGDAADVGGGAWTALGGGVAAAVAGFLGSLARS